jgi:hypothetical protein
MSVSPNLQRDPRAGIRMPQLRYQQKPIQNNHGGGNLLGKRHEHNKSVNLTGVSRFVPPEDKGMYKFSSLKNLSIPSY